MFGTLFSLPDATTTLANIGSYSSPIFSDFSQILWPIVGILLGIGVVLLIIKYLNPNR